jgi:hypothetical protein
MVGVQCPEGTSATKATWEEGSLAKAAKKAAVKLTLPSK